MHVRAFLSSFCFARRYVKKNKDNTNVKITYYSIEGAWMLSTLPTFVSLCLLFLPSFQFHKTLLSILTDRHFTNRNPLATYNSGVRNMLHVVCIVTIVICLKYGTSPHYRYVGICFGTEASPLETM